jgi:asparagine synthase (glutamine-hydrolysing)
MAELRSELEQQGYCFFSDGDTELIIKAYHAWGQRCVERFNGMFAFATGRITLARNRLSIKPLYLAEVAGGLRFASTLPALLAAGGVDTEIDAQAFHHYMSFHGAVPAPHPQRRAQAAARDHLDRRARRPAMRARILGSER